MLTDLLPRPDRAFTSSSWTLRFSWGHSRATCGLATVLATSLWMNPSTPLASDPEAPCSSVPTWDRPSLVRSALIWSASACTLSRLVIWVAILSVSARWTAGSWMSGSMLATKRSVSETWLAVHTATTDSGANMHPKTMRTMATGVRQLNRRPVADRPVCGSGWPVSSCGAGVSVVMDFPRLSRTAELLASDDVPSVHHRARPAASPRWDEPSRRHRPHPGGGVRREFMPS